MSPAEQAAKIYQTEPCARTFFEDLEAHLWNGGYVFSTPEFFIMGRAVPSMAPVRMLVDPWNAFDEADCDTWFIYLAAGNMQRFFQCHDFVGVKKEWLAWERNNAIRWHKFNRTRALCQHSLTMMNAFAGRSTLVN